MIIDSLTEGKHKAILLWKEKENRLAISFFLSKYYFPWDSIIIKAGHVLKRNLSLKLPNHSLPPSIR